MGSILLLYIDVYQFFYLYVYNYVSIIYIFAIIHLCNYPKYLAIIYLVTYLGLLP